MASKTVSVKRSGRGLSPAAQRAVSEAKAGRGKKLEPGVKAELRGEGQASSPAASSPSMSLPSFSMPSLPDLGWSVGEKALFVVLLLVIGAGVYSRVTGTALYWPLSGFNAGRPSGAGMAAGTPAGGASSYYAQQNRRLAVSSDTMATRMAMANPARIA